MYVAIELFMCILPAFYGCLHLWSKAIEVDIETGIVVGVSHNKGVAESIFAYDGSRNITIGYRIDAEVYATLGLYVDATVEMVGSWFAKIARKLHWYVYRRAEREG